MQIEVKIYKDGQVVRTDLQDVAPETLNQAMMGDRLTQALAANATYLALANPTTAQNLTQVQRLTRECNGLIRFLLGRLEDTTGT